MLRPRRISKLLRNLVTSDHRAGIHSLNMLAIWLPISILNVSLNQMRRAIEEGRIVDLPRFKEQGIRLVKAFWDARVNLYVKNPTLAKQLLTDEQYPAGYEGIAFSADIHSLEDLEHALQQMLNTPPS
jgi:hypothetical protein